MDPASLVLASIAVIKPLCVTIHATLNNYSHYTNDAESLRKRFQIQCARLDSFISILYQENKFAPSIPGRLFDTLSRNTQETLQSLVGELRNGFEEYTSLKMHREMASFGTSDKSASPGGLLTRRSPAVLAIASWPVHTRGQTVPDSFTATWAKLAIVTRRLRWTLGRRDTVESVVKAFEEWSERMRAVIEPHIWMLQFYSTTAQF
ncbi:hypothetical protein FPANT_10798 [Fusarium pseudoanthophilum]|uniref:Fungal N-terminal domain-containing protein n=1 Tax=Fusarium pseudoanthophilum TaxID=48495 RepID=A0A8H5NRS6_9HYPO|nr:hypothetical protein FPANT_10798 [Fusarium pseudoanthophilum]